MTQRILLTGSDGYIGSVLAPILVCEGYDVVGLDTGYYRQGWLYHPSAVDYFSPTVNKDIRDISAADLMGFDTVVHLAELSNDPLGEHNPEVTFEINHLGSVRLAELAREAGVGRFVYTSSCSVYGIAEGVVDESSAVNPQTAYAECKVAVERDVMALASDGFAPVFLRNATAYGASPRMRFDIVLNNLAGWAWTTKRIVMTSDGSPWRPLVHVRDIAKAVSCAIAAPSNLVRNQVFNVGAEHANYQVREIAEVVGRVFPDCEVEFGPPSGDDRSYRVNFDKIHQHLPDFRCDWDIEKGSTELRDVFESIDLRSEDFGARPFTRLKTLTYLLETGQLNDRFFWSRR